MVDLSRRTYKRNDIEKIVDNDGILRLNEKRLQEKLDRKYLPIILKKSFRPIKKQT